MPDLGNGVFVHPARQVVAGLLGAGLSTACGGRALLDSACEADQQGTAVFASGLREFLDGILRELESRVVV
ncbi:hypothetical protein ABT256_17205 [Amycolatopsis japonica]|uniref:hypothetical protein n=1 Tax=Amycolatopsis japonica TaxID=208439 RepID=UPI00331A4862